ncbi:MAG: glycosyl hydrolase family 18 protein [Minisyncoccia bacterium]
MMRYVLVFVCASALLFPSSVARAALEESFEVSGWIPYWAVSKGTRSAGENIEALSAVMPFVYAVQKDGTPKDLGGMSKASWKRLMALAKNEGIRVTPTVMWSDTDTIHAILSNSAKRAAHVQEIAELVKKKRYDGIDIDYEGKLAKTRPYFSKFLKELDEALEEKFLSCTIEARTPPEDLYTTIPASLEYANDYEAINEHCDRVNIMAYDQQRADLSLNNARRGTPYYPNADTDWVEKVMKLAAKTIDPDRLVIGIPTYGREIAVKVSPEWFESYDQLWSVNPSYAEETAEDEDVKPSTNKAGERSYSYLPKDASVRLSSLPKAPRGTLSGDEIALRALAYANKTGKSLTVNVVWWSDADAVKDKIELAEELGLRGVALFKIDGGEDEDIWDLF